jgi:hypothetical protein
MSAVAGGSGFTLAATGSQFVTGSTINWNGVARTTTFVSATQLTAAIPASDIATAGTAQVTVSTPAPGGGTSSALAFTIAPKPPVITSLNPSVVTAGSPDFELTVNGTGFVAASVVRIDGSARTTTFVSATQLRAAITNGDVAVAGFKAIIVVNPDGSGGTSNSMQLTVSVAAPPTAKTERITVAPDGSPPNGPSVNGGMDWDGRYFIYASKASNLVANDTNGAWDVFLRDTCAYAPTPCTPGNTRISVTAGSSQANGDSGATASSPNDSLAVSYNGRHVAFVSSASNLVAGDTNGVDDVFLADTCILAATACTPKIVMVSIRAGGAPTVAASSYPGVTDDGRYVIFVSADSGLVTGDTNGVADVFVRDTCLNAASGCTPATTRVSVAADGTQGNAASGQPSFTGRYAAFASAATNLVTGDTNGVDDIFLRDTCIGATGACTPTTQRVSIGNDGGQASGPSSDPQINPGVPASDGTNYHGRFVAVVSSAGNLVAGDTNGVADVFIRDTCANSSCIAPATVRVSLTSTGGQIVGAPSTSPDFLRWDGEVLAFVTAADGVVPEDTNGVSDVYVRRKCWAICFAPDSTTRLSVGASGEQGNAASYAPRMTYDPWGVWMGTFVSDATNLVPGTVPTPYYGSIFRRLWP